MTAHPIETLPLGTSHPTLEETATDMMALNWPDYNRDSDAHSSLGLSKRNRLAQLLPPIDAVSPVTQINGFFLPLVPKETTIDAYDMPDEGKFEILMGEVRDCKVLAQLLDEGPFGACNKQVGAAIKASICEAADTLLAAYSLQKPHTESRDIFDVPAGLSIKLLRHTLVATAVKFGAIDYREGLAEFETKVFPSSAMSTARLRNGGTSNKYLTECLDILEWPDNDYIEPESPTYLTVSAIPGTRVSFETDFVSPSLASRFLSEHAKKGRLSASANFSIRVDYDDKSPNGFSFDIGRDVRDSDSYARSGDPTGISLQQLRPEEGSHFTKYFESVSPEDMSEFINGINTLLKVDVAMKQHTDRLHNRSGLNDPARLARIALNN